MEEITSAFSLPQGLKEWQTKTPKASVRRIVQKSCMRLQFIPFWNTQGNFSPRLAECQAMLFYVNIFEMPNWLLKFCMLSILENILNL